MSACVTPSPRCPHRGPVQLHHVLGRDEDGYYIAPIIFVPLCQPGCHQRGIHEVLRRAALDGKRTPTDGLLLGRVGATFSWLGAGSGDVLLPATFFAGVAEVLCPISRRLLEAEADRG